MADQSVHITIQKGRTLPQLDRCKTCCLHFHCPFCSLTLFNPTKLSKCRAHLDNHFNRAVCHEGYTIHRCGLGCRLQLHYHCLYCGVTLVRKPDFIKHLDLCKKKHSGNLPSLATTPPVVVPTTSTAPATPSGQVKRVRMKPMLQRKCPICQVTMNKRNFKSKSTNKKT